MILVDVIVADARWAATWPQAEALVPKAVEAALAVAPPAGRAAAFEVAVRLDRDDAVRDLNRLWRGKDRATNVLSFPAAPIPHPPGPRHLGDIALAYETTLREADQEGKSLADHAAHLVVHGTLHLLGCDHEAEGDADAMEALETEALARLGIANPYQDRAA